MIQSLKSFLGKPVAGPDTDPQRFFGTFFALPNPDPILRQMGQAERVYTSIMADAHVLGDIRSIRGNFRSHDWRLVAGDEGDSKSQAALELVQDWMQRTNPNQWSDWLEVMWQMSAAFMTGYRPHELVWEMMDGAYLPAQVIDRPTRRMKFALNGDPLLLSRGNMIGEPVEPYQFVVSRHMPTYDNPYGVAVMSSCFWPWTFKTGGWRYFVKFCERHGLPWPVARYPLGTSDKDINDLSEALEDMLGSGYAMVPEGTGVELLTATTSGSLLPQESLINRANAEMSKALTGQAMVSELHGVGARAASETALKRQESIDDSVRDIAGQSMGQIFRWITLFNFGDGISPPKLEFFQQGTGGKDRAETYQVVANMGARPSKTAMLEELGIPAAKHDDDALQPQAKRDSPSGRPGAASALGGSTDTTKANTAPAKAAPASPPVINMSGVPGFEFARAAGMTEDEALQLATTAADRAIEDHMIAPVAEMLAEYERQGKTLVEFQAALSDLVGDMDDEALREVIDRSLSYSILKGAVTKAA